MNLYWLKESQFGTVKNQSGLFLIQIAQTKNENQVRLQQIVFDEFNFLGLLKDEFSISKGSAIFLSPKCYYMEDKTTGECKKALKGIHSQTMLQYDDFIDVLYNNSTVMRDQTRLRRNLKKFTVHLQREKKRALNSVYYKFKISSDFITCSPHTDEHGQYL